MMHTYRVAGADRETGSDVVREFVAASAEEARLAANQAGIVVGSVEEAVSGSPEQSVLAALDGLADEVRATRQAIEQSMRQLRLDLERAQRVKVIKRRGMTFGEYISWTFTIASGILFSSVLGFFILWVLIVLGIGGLAGLAGLAGSAGGG